MSRLLRRLVDTPIRKRRSSFSLDASKQKTAYESCRCAEFLLCLTVVPFNSTLESAIANLVSFKSLSQDCVVALCKAVKRCCVGVSVKKRRAKKRKEKRRKKKLQIIFVTAYLYSPTKESNCLTANRFQKMKTGLCAGTAGASRRRRMRNGSRLLNCVEVTVRSDECHEQQSERE